MSEISEKLKKDDLYWLSVADKIAEKSKCKRRKVGSIILDIYGRLVSSGYNGHPRHCLKDDICFREGVESHTNMSIGACVHSETNSLLFANFKEIQEGSIYLTAPPCELCAPLIVQAGLANLVYYSDGFDEIGIELIKSLGAERLLSIRRYNR